MSDVAGLLFVLLVVGAFAGYYHLGYEAGYKAAIKDYFDEVLYDCVYPNPFVETTKEVKE